MNKMLCALLLSPLTAGTLDLAWGDTARRGSERRVEVLRYGEGPSPLPSASATERLGAVALLGPLRTQTFFIVVHLEPNEELRSARGRLFHGFLHTERHRGPGWKAVRVLGRVGLELVVQGLAGEVHDGIGPLARVMLPADDETPPESSPRLQSELHLRAGDFSNHTGYAVGMVTLAANPLTRIELTRIVTRVGDDKQRSWARPLVVHAGSSLSHAEAVRLMTGGGIAESE